MNLEMCVTGNDCYGSGTRAIPYPSCQGCEAMPPTKRVPKLLSCNWVKYVNLEKSWGSAVKPRACLTFHRNLTGGPCEFLRGPLRMYSCAAVSFQGRCFDHMITKVIEGNRRHQLFIWGKGKICWCLYNAHKWRMINIIHFPKVMLILDIVSQQF